MAGVDGKVIGGPVRIAPHHPLGLRARELLQSEERGLGLHVPRRPGVPKVVPLEVRDPDTLERLVPGLG